jgi:mono/diheme cytochrome c family protein
VFEEGKMMHSTIKMALIGAVFACAASIALAQGKPQARFDIGALEYKSSCGACHGLTGKGDGPYKVYLTLKSPTDLTTLAKRNGGVFPVQRIYEMIDGRQMDPAHGSRDMPVWGQHYKAEGNAYFAEVPGPYDTEAFVRTRILALVDYLHRLQVK